MKLTTQQCGFLKHWYDRGVLRIGVWVTKKTCTEFGIDNAYEFGELLVNTLGFKRVGVKGTQQFWQLTYPRPITELLPIMEGAEWTTQQEAFTLEERVSILETEVAHLRQLLKSGAS